jgi:hypothetical protein
MEGRLPLTCAVSKLSQNALQEERCEHFTGFSIADLSLRLVKYNRADTKTARRFRWANTDPAPRIKVPEWAERLTGSYCKSLLSFRGERLR